MSETPSAITSVMEERRRFPPPPEVSARAKVRSEEEYKELYRLSLEQPDRFWAKQAKRLDWARRWRKVQRFDPAKVKIEWFVGGRLNASQNCLDRHLATPRRNKAAILWEPDAPGPHRTLTYQDLHREVSRFASALKARGIRKGDRVCVYMPMVPEAAITMLACARIGAIHSVVFGGFSAESLKNRILDAGATALVTSDEGLRGGKAIPIKQIADEALSSCPAVGLSVVFRRTGKAVPMKAGRDVFWDEFVSAPGVSPACEPEIMDAEDPLFILYTSGSTGKPKGVLHTTGGYLLYAALTHEYVFDIREEDVYWCTADVGWVTGHSYVVYGPLANGGTSLMFEGIPTWPKPDRFWQIVEKHRVNVFYTAPTALRALMREGENWPDGRDLGSLRILGTVGEPINPEAWMWYHRVIGKGRCPIVDTWWQTETGGILISALPGAVATKPGSAGRPLFGIEPVILKEDGTPAGANEGGSLTLKRPWPGIMRTVYGHHERFVETYFQRFPPSYLTGDGARVDPDGDYWLMGRIDDVLNVSAHRIGTAEVESALVSHRSVAEAAVVGFPHEIKGQGIYAYVTLKAGVEKSDALQAELSGHVAKEIGPIARPDKIQFADGLPKTRSGKIMRRILRKIAEGQVSDLGDTTTLADPAVVSTLVQGRL